MEASESSQVDPKTTQPPEVDETKMTSPAQAEDTAESPKGDRPQDTGGRAVRHGTAPAPSASSRSGGAVADSAKDTVVFPKISPGPATGPHPAGPHPTGPKPGGAEPTTSAEPAEPAGLDPAAFEPTAPDLQPPDLHPPDLHPPGLQPPGPHPPGLDRAERGSAASGATAPETTAPDLEVPSETFTPVTDTPQRAPEPSSRPAQSAKTQAGRPRLVDRLLRSAPRWVPPVLTVEGLVMYILALRASPGPLAGVSQSDIDGLGLISALPVTAFAAVIVLIAAFFVTLAANIDRKGLLLFQLASVVFALHGASALVHDEPRFHTAWTHAGFVEYIARTGDALPGLDARFAWPGFFALFAFITRAAGVTDLAPILQWTPLLSNLLYLLPFVMILRLLVATTRARWFAAMLFVLTQWIGQDYFSPQGFTFFLYLAFVAVLLRWFGRASDESAGPPGKGRVRAALAWLNRLTPGEIPQSSPSLGDKVIMLSVLVGLFAATTASHQITPFMMLGALVGLLVVRRTTLSYALPLLLGLIVLAWISYQAMPFWAGNLDRIFGGLGRIFENLQDNTGDRLVGRDARNTLVLQVRLGILGVILMLAAAGLLRRIRRGVTDRAAVVMLCIPVLALALQSYGGEIGLRIYLFALPGVCILAAYAFFPNLPAGTPDSGGETVPLRKRYTRPLLNPELTRRLSLVLAVCTALVLSMAFLVARYGNEKFERVTTDEVAAMRYVYAHNTPSARLLYLVPEVGREVTPTIPWRERDIETVEYLEVLATSDPNNIEPVITRLRQEGPQTYLVFTNGQAAFLELSHGYAPDWGKRYRAALDKSRQLKRVFANGDAAVYTLSSYPRGAQPEPPAVFDFGDSPSTPWTPLGLLALGTTAASLFLHEVLRMRARKRPGKGRAWALRVGLVSFAIAVAVILERFISLGFDGH
ncbi:hypothetical protein SAMN05421505_11532 [Sinosporangium album]|uniref:Uncharacterized protein n=2 Tax=Sinosporangium album TaxID=504805 RepID=A0A1G8C1W8_9ACTN|nr:hypothetical protein SAMN05421505_11532 [Sinosporangium album]